MEIVINAVFWFVPYLDELRPILGDLFTMWLFMLATFAISVVLYGLLNRCVLRHLNLPRFAYKGPLVIIQRLLGTISIGNLNALLQVIPAPRHRP